VPEPFDKPFAAAINARTRYCAVFGHPVRHSASPALQNAGMAALDLNWRYIACDVRPEELREALMGAKRMGFVGVNLTVPHKQLALDFMDALDESAKLWKAVNTVRFEGREKGGEWLPLQEFEESAPEKVRAHGFNTDADAIARSIRDDLGVDLKGARVLLLGVGGAGSVAALKLASEGVKELFIVNRTHSKAAGVAAEIRRRHPAVKVLLEYPRGELDLAINATSLGLAHTDALPVDEKLFSLRQARCVFDLIYRPAETRLLTQAKANGCRVANGLGMLLYQGAKALEIWSGKIAPLETMRRALAQNVYGESDLL
jgi:shikimate dehydrogenase